MSDRIHRFHCARCDRFIYGQTLTELVTGVNYHATSMHPSDFSNWTASTIIISVNYTSPVGTSSPANYPPVPDNADLEENHHRTKTPLCDPVQEPEITPDDIALLAAHGIRW